jgi:hypothetical protein
MFGNRSGGTNQTAAGIDTAERGQVADAMGQAREGAASGLAQIGGQETGQGLGAESGALSSASTLGSLSSANRATSQQIHDNAVSNWGNAISTILLGL